MSIKQFPLFAELKTSFQCSCFIPAVCCSNIELNFHVWGIFQFYFFHPVCCWWYASTLYLWHDSAPCNIDEMVFTFHLSINFMNNWMSFILEFLIFRFMLIEAFWRVRVILKLVSHWMHAFTSSVSTTAVFVSLKRRENKLHCVIVLPLKRTLDET